MNTLHAYMCIRQKKICPIIAREYYRNIEIENNDGKTIRTVSKYAYIWQVFISFKFSENITIIIIIINEFL